MVLNQPGEPLGALSSETPSHDLAGPGESSLPPAASPGVPLRRAPRWLGIIPFFSSALLFVSGIFAIFAPLPLLAIFFGRGRGLFYGAVLFNLAVVGLALGPTSLAFYAAFIVVASIALVESLVRRVSLERAVILAMGAILLAGLGIGAYYTHVHHLEPVAEIKRQVGLLTDALAQQVNSGNWLSPEELDDWKANMVLELPSAIGIFTLALVWINLVALFRINPGQVRERLGLDPQFMRKWKAPEHLVWPTIGAGFIYLLNLGTVSDWSLNLFKFLMAVYAIQGLSVLAFMFDVWKLRGLLRTLGFLVAAFLVTPLLLSLGFFDLWFDFRGKFRHS